MRIGIQTWGSEGDIRPFVALGAALSRRGHHVELVYTEIGERRYEAVAESLGFTARAVASPIVDGDQAIAIGLKVLKTRDQLQQGLILGRELLEPVMPQMYDAAVDLCQRSDLLIHHFILHGARAAADIAGVPTVTMQFAHMLIASRHIHPSGTPRLGEWWNALAWKIGRFALNKTLLKDVNRLRERVGLSPLDDLMNQAWPSPLLNLVAASPAFLDRPDDWPAFHQLCGFVELPSHQHEPVSPEVEAFLANGPAPVFMGFGSLMPIGGSVYSDDTISAFQEATRVTGCRAIIQSDADLASTDRVLHVKRTPHNLVFPRCAAVVHHAGAGTTHTTLRAGVPSIPVPHVSDQFAWAEELHRVGAAPSPLLRRKLTAKALAARIIETLKDPRKKAAAMSMRERMQPDNGAETAADMIEKLWNKT